MKVISQERYGSAEVLEFKDIERPSPGDDDVLVRVRAASVNALDWHYMRGTPLIVRPVFGWPGPKPAVRGRDVAGCVEEVGANVECFQAGDEVFGICDGAFAEFVCAPAEQFAAKPKRLSFEEAAASGVAALTALQGLRDVGRIETGQPVLIIGASGGVGTFAVQIAKSFESEVTGVCSSRNVDLVRSLGADHVIDYTKADPVQGGRSYDLIFQLAGTHSPGKLRKALNPTGTLVLSSGMGRLGGLDRLLAAVLTNPFVSQSLRSWVADENAEDRATIADLLESGAVTPVIDRTYPLADTPEAIRYVEEGHTRGKVVITV